MSTTNSTNSVPNIRKMIIQKIKLSDEGCTTPARVAKVLVAEYNMDKIKAKGMVKRGIEHGLARGIFICNEGVGKNKLVRLSDKHKNKKVKKGGEYEAGQRQVQQAEELELHKGFEHKSDSKYQLKEGLGKSEVDCVNGELRELVKQFDYLVSMRDKMVFDAQLAMQKAKFFTLQINELMAKKKKLIDEVVEPANE